VGDHVVAEESEPARDLVERGVGHEACRLRQRSSTALTVLGRLQLPKKSTSYALRGPEIRGDRTAERPDCNLPSTIQPLT
jgi:hypothetical protein